MTQVAQACGLRQSSLYYWFGQKEAILRELLSLNRITMDFIATRIADTGESPAVRLLRLLLFDLNELWRAPVDITEIDTLAEQQPEGFREYWKDMAILHQWLTALVSEGIERGEFARCDPELVALQVCAAEQASPTSSAARPRSRVGGLSPFRLPELSRTEYVTATAQWLVRSLLTYPAAMPAIAAAAMAHHDIDASAPTATALPLAGG